MSVWSYRVSIGQVVAPESFCLMSYKTKKEIGQNDSGDDEVRFFPGLKSFLRHRHHLFLLPTERKFVEIT